MKIRLGQAADLDALVSLEDRCFEPERRDGRRPIRHSLQSRHQEIWVAESEGTLSAALTLRFHPRTCRIYSIAVDPAHQGKGIGQKLLELAESKARDKGCVRMQLEVDAGNKNLIQWYRKNGYHPMKTLHDYYGRNWHAARLILNLART